MEEVVVVSSGGVGGGGVVVCAVVVKGHNMHKHARGKQEAHLFPPSSRSATRRVLGGLVPRDRTDTIFDHRFKIG